MTTQKKNFVAMTPTIGAGKLWHSFNNLSFPATRIQPLATWAAAKSSLIDTYATAYDT